MAVDRHAEVTWNGGLMEGSGRIDSTGSGAFGGLEVTWASMNRDASHIRSTSTPCSMSRLARDSPSTSAATRFSREATG